VASGDNTGGYSYLGGRVGHWKQDGREEPESSRTWKGRVSAVVAHSNLAIIGTLSIAIFNCNIDDGRVVIDVSGPGEVGEWMVEVTNGGDEVRPTPHLPSLGTDVSRAGGSSPERPPRLPVM
jgi:hypothetical protein